MYARLNSFGIHGLAGFDVTAEADISGGLPALNIVGYKVHNVILQILP